MSLTLGNGFTNVTGSGSRLVIKRERLETRTRPCGDRIRSTPARACVRIWKWIQKCNGLMFTIGTKTRKARTNAHGSVAIALGARAFAFGNGIKNVTGSAGSRLVIKPERLETRTWFRGDHTGSTTARACIRTRTRARSTRAQ